MIELQSPVRGEGGPANSSSTQSAGGASTRGDATEDWTIVSGGGDGAVAHWSVVGLASERELADGVEEAGVELHKIGDYEVSRKTRGALSSSISGAKCDPIGGSQFAADRRPGVSHIMVACLPVGHDVQPVAGGSGAISTITSAGAAAWRQSKDTKASAPRHSGAARTADRAGEDSRIVGGRDCCVVVSGGLASVLELVLPLRHVGWAGRDTTPNTTSAGSEHGKKREVLRMARVPSSWQRAALSIAQTVVDDVDGEAEEFMVMCSGGWLGWYQCHHRRFELASRVTLPSPDPGYPPAATATGGHATCFSLCPGPRETRLKPAAKSMGLGRPSLPRVIVGYSDGSIACVAMPLPMSPSTRSREVGRFDSVDGDAGGGRGAVPVRRLRRVSAGGAGVGDGGGAAVEAAVTAVCSLSAPLVVAGDSDGRLGLWTISSTRPSSASPLLWEDKTAHRGPVIAIQRLNAGALPATAIRPNSNASAASAVTSAQFGGAPPPPRSKPPLEWVVSAGGGGEVRVWKVPTRWPDGGATSGGGRTGSGLEFCATLLTNSSVCSFSCVVLSLSGSTPAATKVHHEDGGDGEVDGEGMGRKRRRRRAGAGGERATARRLYCVIGSDNGFVQAWELGLDGQEGLGGQPLWSQKIHDAAVTSMDMWEVPSSAPGGETMIASAGASVGARTGVSAMCPTLPGTAGSVVGSGQQVDRNRGLPQPGSTSRAAAAADRPSGEGLGGLTVVAEECLIVSGALDRTLCVFRARFGQGLSLLRRLNVACSPRGLPGALIVGTPVEGACGGIEGTQLEAGVILAAARGELTQLGIRYKHGDVRSGRPIHKSLRNSHGGGDDPVSSSSRYAPESPLAGERDHATERHQEWPTPTTAGTVNYLDKLPKGYNRPLTGSRSDRHSATTATGGRPSTTGKEMPKNRPLRETTLDSRRRAESPSERPDALRSRFASHAGRTGRDQRHQQHGQFSRPFAAAEDENDMVGRWDYASSEDHVSGATYSGMFHPAASLGTGATVASATTAYSVDSSSQATTLGSVASTRDIADQQGGSGGSGDLALATQQAPVALNEQMERRAVGDRHHLQRYRLRAGVVGMGAESAPDETQSLNDVGCGRWGGRGHKRMRPDADVRGGSSSTGREANQLRCTRSCEGMMEQKKLRTEEIVGKRQPSGAATSGGFVGDVGRWQQRLGIAVEREGNSGGGELAGASLRRPSSATATTVKDLMEDPVLKEAFDARGRHKKSPILAREVKAILKTWAPGVVEACSRADFSAAMGDLGGGERVSFLRVCEIAAAVLGSTGGVSARLSEGQAVGGVATATSATAAAVLRRGRSCVGQSRRPSKYQNMAKVKTRLQYNSMGEQVVVRTALDSIDAFATRSRQSSHLNAHQQEQQQQTDRVIADNGEATNKDLAKTVGVKANLDQVGAQDIRGSGWDDKDPDYEETRLDEGDDHASEGPHAASPPPVTQTVSKSLGFGWPNFSSVGSKIADSICSDKEDMNSLARPSRATAANLGDVPAGLRDVWSSQGSCLFSSWPASFYAHRSEAAFPAAGTDGAAEVLGEGECVRAVREVLDTRAAAQAAALVACRRHGRCPPDAHALIVGDGVHDATSSSPSFVEDSEGASRSSSLSSRCPASRVASLGAILYGGFRRRYGLQRTAEERVAGLLGSIVEHSRSSAVLRLFARMLGAPIDTKAGGGRWPLQTRSEDADNGLEPQLADLVTTARGWLTTRGFLTTDGPLAGVDGSGAGRGSHACVGDSVGIGWRKAVVVRTHAALCASVLLKPGWGPGHQVMGAAEQAILQLPTIVRGHGGRWAGQRGQQPWSEYIDGEEFLETLLLVVLRARDTSSRTYDGLFGRRAVEGHSFLLAKARDINAAAVAAAADAEKAAEEAKKTTTERRLASLLDDIPKSPPSLLQAVPAPGEHHLADHGASFADAASHTGTRVSRRESGVGDDSETHALKGVADGPAVALNDALSDDEKGGVRGTRFRDREEELGEGGRVLKRLKPLLDSFIREDTQRTGGAAEFVDPRMTSAENDAARALIRRYVDAYDGQACYLDIVPFTELPGVCETQLRGADTHHWEALLDYFETAGAGVATALAALPGGTSLHGDGGTKRGELMHEGSAECGHRSVSAFRAGGASSCHPVGSRTAAYDFRSFSAASKTCHSGAVTPGIAAEWPRAGWGPGSLTVSCPPRAAGASETARSTAAMMTAFAGSTDTVMGGGRARVGESIGVGSKPLMRPMMSLQPQTEEGWSSGGDHRAGEEGEEVNPDFLAMGKVDGGNGSLPGGDSTIGASGEIGNQATRPSKDDLASTRFSDIDNTGKPVEGVVGKNSVADGNESLEGGDPDQAGGTTGKEPSKHGTPVQGEERTQQQQQQQQQQQGKGVDGGMLPGHQGQDRGGGEKYPQESSMSLGEDLSVSGGMLLYNLDCGTLEPPSPEPPSPERQVKSKHTYRVPRGGRPNYPPTPIFHEAVDPASMAAQMYSSIASSKAKKAAADAAVEAERQHLSNAAGGGQGWDGKGRTGGPLVLKFPPSLKDAMIREGRSKSRERRRAEAEMYTPGPGGAGGRLNEEAHQAAAENRESWTGVDVGTTQESPSGRGMLEGLQVSQAEEDSALEGKDGFVLKGTVAPATERPVSPKATRSRSPNSRGDGGIRRPPSTSPSARPNSQERRPPPPSKKPPSSAENFDTGREASESGGDHGRGPAAKVGGKTAEGRAPPAAPGASDGPGTGAVRARGGGRGRGAATAGRGGQGAVMRGRRRGPETTGDSDDSDDDGGGGRVVDAKKTAQQKMIEDMMAEQAAKRRASGDAMKRLIEEEEERKRLRRAEEEAARIAQEKARQEMEERQKRELEERRRALAKKRAELEEKNRQLEEERLQREAERQAADQARREANAARRQQEAAKRAEEERLAREEEARWAKAEEERLRREEEARAKEAEEARKRALAERERAREFAEQERMARHDEDVDVVIQAHLAMVREAERVERAAQAARETEELKNAAELAKRRHACLFMYKADEESGLWNERWKMQEHVEKVEEIEVKKAKIRSRPRVTWDEHGNPIDIRLWEMECTSRTDADGRLIQRETYSNVDRDGNEAGSYTFDPRDVFQGEGGGIGGRGGGRGDGTTPVDPADGKGDTGGGEEEGGEDEAHLDAEGLLERERRWMEAIFAASRPDDLSCLFQDSTGSSKFNPDAFFPMVLSERVAWPEYMDMVRAALAKQADAIIKQGAALETGSSGGRSGAGCQPRAAATEGAAATTAAHVSAGNEPNTPTPRLPSDCQASDGTPPGIRELELGKTLRGTTAAGPESWALFRFDLPTAGPILTVVLDIADGDPDIFVSKGKLSFAGLRLEVSAATATPRAGAELNIPSASPPSRVRGERRESAAAAGVPALPGGGGGGGDDGEWNASSTHRGLRVVKIFPRDPGYGPGEYFVGVLSKGMPSRFVLRVSAAAPADEVSTHMQTAAAIVDNLAIMSKMDPHRLVKDFVGARLEAEETLRKERASTLVDRAIEGTTPSGSHSSQGRYHREGEEEHQQRSGSSSSSDRPNSPSEQWQRWPEAATVELSALRRRERELPSRVAVLDDRMTRARPTGLLAAATAKLSVSVSAAVSDSSPAVLDSGPGPARRDESVARLVDALAGAVIENSSTASSLTAAVTPGRYRHGQRRRRMSVLLRPLEDSGGGVASGGRRRPWTTSHGEAFAAEDVTQQEQSIDLSGTVQPFRSSAPEGDSVPDAKIAADIHTVTRQDRSRVRSAPTSDQGGRCYVPKVGGDVIRFGAEQEIVPRVSSASSPGPSPWPSSSVVLVSSTESSPRQQPQTSYTSTLSAPAGGGSGPGSRSVLAELRAEREAVEAGARQALARVAPNLFPEILVAPPTTGDAGGSGNGMRGPRGWVAGA
eukprot:g7695.t1